MDDGVWAGIDAGKGFHWAHVVDAAGTDLLSRRVENDEADLLDLLEKVLSLAAGDRLAWAIDQPGGDAALFGEVERELAVCREELQAFAASVYEAADHGSAGSS